MSIYDYSVTKSNGEELKLSDFKGKVIMIVNTATGCGFTPQYEAIETLYEKYHDKGLEIIDIPCNQFGIKLPEQMTKYMNFVKFITIQCFHK